MKKTTLIIALLICACTIMNAQMIPPYFWGINHWLPYKLLNAQNPFGGIVERPSVQQMVKSLGAKVYRIGGNDYDKGGTAIGTDSTNNDYIRVMQIIQSQNPNAKFVIQVPINAPGFTPDSAELLVSNIVAFYNGPGPLYFAVGNEWDAYRHSPTDSMGYSVRYMMNVFKSYALAMKIAEADIKIVAPSLSFFSAADSTGKPIMDSLIGGANDITGIITGTGDTLLDNKKYMLDVINFHSYGGSNGDLSNATTLTSFQAAKAGLINNSSNPNSGFAKNLDDLFTFINRVNGSRSASPLTYGITETNVCFVNQTVSSQSITDDRFLNTAKGLSARSFFAGQHLVSIMATALEKGTATGNPQVEFVIPWSIHESSGKGDNDDLGLTKDSATTGLPTPLSTYHHYQLMAQHFYGRFQAGSVMTAQTPTVRTFASIVDEAGIYVMILNRSDVGYTFGIDFHNNTPSVGTVKLKYDVDTTYIPLDSASTYPSALHPTLDSIGPNTTLLLLFNCHGRKYFKKEYSLEKANNDDPPALRQIGDRDVHPDAGMCEEGMIEGDVNSDVTYSNGTYWVTGDVNLNGSKLTFDNAIVVISPNVLIKGNSNSSIEVKNGSVLYGCNGPWEGLELVGSHSAGEQITVDHSYIYNAITPIKATRVPIVQVRNSIMANGTTGIWLDECQTFAIDQNVFGQYDVGIKTSNTLPGYSSTIQENDFIEVGKGMEFNNDDHAALDVSCNIINFLEFGINSNATNLNDIGNSSLSSGNLFLPIDGTMANFIEHTGNAPQYFAGPNELMVLTGQNAMNITISPAVMDNLCAVSYLASYTCKDYLLFTGVTKEKDNNSYVKVFPNPSSGLFNIEAKGEYELSVIDMLGRQLLARRSTGNGSFELREKGIYVVTVRNEEGVKSAKIIVE